MVDLKDAVRRVKEYAAHALEIDQGEMLLEEILPTDLEHWSITLSFNSRLGPQLRADISKLLYPYSDRREYKSFRVNKQTGDVEGMFNSHAA
jgi:hypothetical protein